MLVRGYKCVTRYNAQQGFRPKTQKSHLVYDLKFVGSSEFELVAPMPEQLKTTTTQSHISMKAILKFASWKIGRNFTGLHITSGKCIVAVPNCSGMGATKCKLVLRSWTNSQFDMRHCQKLMFNIWTGMDPLTSMGPTGYCLMFYQSHHDLSLWLLGYYIEQTLMKWFLYMIWNKKKAP